MATFIMLGHFSDQGIRSVKDTTKRVETVKAAAKRPLSRLYFPTMWVWSFSLSQNPSSRSVLSMMVCLTLIVHGFV